MKTELPPWSYSLLDSFSTCPRKAYHRYILKEKEPDSPALVEGRAVHEALDKRIKGEKLPERYARFSPMAESIIAALEKGMKVYSELRMGVKQGTTGLEACSFWDDDVWGRGAADIILKKESVAMIFDWKTGKKREKEDQIFMLMLFVFKHFPGVERIVGCNLWLEEGEIGRQYALGRANATVLWKGVLGRIRTVEIAAEKNEWPALPSGICKFCPVKSCEHNRS